MSRLRSEEKGTDGQYKVSVGAVVLRGNRILITRRIAGFDVNHWRIPSGFPLPNETLSATAIREVQEETMVKASCEGLLGVRHLIYDQAGQIFHEVHLVFKMAWVSSDPKPDGVEVDAAEFVSIAEFETRERLSSVYVAMLEKALSGRQCLQETYASLKRTDIHLNIAYL